MSTRADAHAHFFYPVMQLRCPRVVAGSSRMRSRFTRLWLNSMAWNRSWQSVMKPKIGLAATIAI